MHCHDRKRPATPYASMDILYLQDELQGIYDTFKPRKRPSQTFVVDRYINQNVGLDENEVINQLCKFNQRGKISWAIPQEIEQR